MSKKYLMWIIAAIVAAGGFFGYQYWRDLQSRISGFAGIRQRS
jgi:predicted negative regulator of RcsB-dependent stress response